METEDQVAELKKEKAEVECQLKVALRRVVELEEESRQREAALRQSIAELVEELKRQRESTQEKLKAEQESIQEQLGEMQSRIEELKGQGAKNSQNSSKPPSSDGLKRKTHSRRKSSGRKSGGQNGHAGATRELSQKIDTVVPHRPERCEQCGEDLRAFQGQVVERRQVQDLPKIGLLVEEHQVEEVCCLHCQWRSRGFFPPEIKAGTLETMNKVAHFWHHRGVRSVPKPIRDYWVAEYFDILAAGYAAQPSPIHLRETLPKRKGPPKQTPAKNLLDAFLKRAEQVLAFMDDLSLPFTNNQAERDLRMAKVQQKISGTFRSEEGATCFSRIRSYLSTMSKQGYAMLSALVAVFNGYPLPIAWSF